MQCVAFYPSPPRFLGRSASRGQALLARPGSAGLNYAGAAFIALSDDARTEFLAEVARLTTSWAAFKFSRLTDVN
jgi:hypothetical protein